MVSRMVLAVFLCGASVAHADGKDAFLDSTVRGWFAEATHVAKGMFVTDAKGCLSSLVNTEAGLKLIPILGQDKKPLCRKVEAGAKAVAGR